MRGEAGGRTASVSLEVALSAETLKNPMLLTKYIRCGFDRVRQAIEEELAGPKRSRAALPADELAPLARAATATLAAIARSRRISSGC